MRLPECCPDGMMTAQAAQAATVMANQHGACPGVMLMLIVIVIITVIVKVIIRAWGPRRSES